MEHFLSIGIILDDVSILIPLEFAVISFVGLYLLFILFFIFIPENSNAIRVIFTESFREKVSDSNKVDER